MNMHAPIIQRLTAAREVAEAEYLAILARMPDAHHRTPEQQSAIDEVLGRKIKADYAVWHNV